jgi:hypothetical protein
LVLQYDIITICVCQALFEIFSKKFLTLQFTKNRGALPLG